MQKTSLKFLAIIACSLWTVTAFSQFPWRVDGNNAAQLGTPLPRIGTNVNVPLLFETNDTERMRLTQAGRLGIGTTTPTSVLEVNGNGFPSSEIFRTQTRINQSSYWRMFRGNSEKAAFYNLVNEEHLRLQTMRPGSAMVFHLSHFDPIPITLLFVT